MSWMKSARRIDTRLKGGVDQWVTAAADDVTSV